MAAHEYSDTTLSEPPLSPFSNRSLLSDGTHTSDEPADLGAFNSVFRAMHQLQAQQQPIVVRTRADSRADTYNSEAESDAGVTSATWSTLDDYLDNYDPRDPDNVGGPDSPYTDDDADDAGDNSVSSDTEGMEIEGLVDGDDITPSLGDFASAFNFLDAEKAKLSAARADSAGAHRPSTRGTAWNNAVERKRKRRRKRKIVTKMSEDQPYATVVPSREGSPSSLELSSSPEKGGTTASDHGLLSSASKPRRPKSSYPPHPLVYSSATLIQTSTSTSIPSSNPRLLQLRSLIQKLRRQFPQNDFRLKHLILNDTTAENNFIDTRGPEPGVGDPLTHVFIDHSNILIGFLNYIKRSQPSTYKRGSGKPLLYFPALSLILERGRPITRRVLATSSPLYQNMDNAKELDYNVHVYVRVPDMSGESAGVVGAATTTGAGNSTGNHVNGNTGGNSMDPAANGNHPPTSVALGLRSMVVMKNRRAAVSTSMLRDTNTNAAESDPGHSSRSGGTRASNHTRSTSIPTVTSNPVTSSTPSLASQASAAAQRVRYREQGVDELLQLKLHQALLSPEADPPPPGATIILATGDGASGQFNEDGFVGAVKTALNKGWNVELYAWQSGISGMWKKVADEWGGKDSQGKGRFLVQTIDKFGADLVQ